MPKAILEFNLPEEREEYEICHYANRFYSSIIDIREELYRNESISMEKFFEIIDNAGIREII